MDRPTWTGGPGAPHDDPAGLELMPCGHTVRVSGWSEQLLRDLLAIHGIDARAQLDEAARENRELHLAGACVSREALAAWLSRSGSLP